MPRSKLKWGKGIRVEVTLDGADKLIEKLRQMGPQAAEAVTEATHNAIDVAAEPIRRDAPGPHIEVVQSDKPNSTGVKAFEAGPDKAHWYYQFFETGVQPFEINLIKRRTQRSALQRAGPKAGQRMSGRKVKGEATVLRFAAGGEIVFAKRVRRGGMAARPFMRGNFDAKRDAMQNKFGDTIHKKAIDPHLEKR